MGITEKVAYLKGLADGLNLDKDSKEGKLFAAIIDVLDDMALEIEDMQELQMELSEGLDAVSDDLEDIEDIVYEEWEDDDDYVMRTKRTRKRKTARIATLLPAPPARRRSSSTRASWKRARSFAPTAVSVWSLIWRASRKRSWSSSPRIDRHIRLAIMK